MTGTTATSRSPRGLRALTLVAGAAVAAVTAAALLPGASASTGTPSDETSWNEMEHEARRSLAEARQDQDRVLNPREHEGHRSPSADSPAGRATVPGACAELLSRAWDDLGHFSDGMESYLLRTPPCSTD